MEITLILKINTHFGGKTLTAALIYILLRAVFSTHVVLIISLFLGDK